VLRGWWGREKQGGIKALKCTDWQLQLRPRPVTSRSSSQTRCDKEIAQHPGSGHLHPGPASHSTKELLQQWGESWGATSAPQLHQVHTEERGVSPFKWNLKHISWFYTPGSGKAVAGMTPDRKYRLWCFTVPKPPLASGVHKPPGSCDYDILTCDKPYLTPGEISLIFNLA